MTTNRETKNIKKTQQKHHLVLTIFSKNISTNVGKIV